MIKYCNKTPPILIQCLKRVMSILKHFFSSGFGSTVNYPEQRPAYVNVLLQPYDLQFLCIHFITYNINHFFNVIVRTGERQLFGLVAFKTTCVSDNNQLIRIYLFK